MFFLQIRIRGSVRYTELHIRILPIFSVAFKMTMFFFMLPHAGTFTSVLKDSKFLKEVP
jgi:hypothetical protein